MIAAAALEELCKRYDGIFVRVFAGGKRVEVADGALGYHCTSRSRLSPLGGNLVGEKGGGICTGFDFALERTL